MPGDTPQEAVTAFLSPLKEAVSVLDGRGAITVNRHGGWARGQTYSWVLNATTLGYNYKLEQAGGDVWRMHWHPDGVSHVRVPHLHVPPEYQVPRPCERMTFENAIRWCIEDGAPLTCTRSEAEGHLLLTETPHKLHRSWSSPLDRPELGRPQG